MEPSHPNKVTGKPGSTLADQLAKTGLTAGRQKIPACRRSGISMSLLGAILEASSSSSSSSFCSSDDESSESSASSSGDATLPTEQEDSPREDDAWMEDSSTTASNAQQSPQTSSSGLSWNDPDFVPYWDDEWQTNHGTFSLREEGQADRQERRGAAGDRSTSSRPWYFMTCGNSDDSGDEAEEVAPGPLTPLTLTQRRLLMRRRQERAYRQQLREENSLVSLRAMLYSLLLACSMMAIALGAAAYINGGLHVPQRLHKGGTHQ
ncbi:hypothetical protein PspLS_10620 [Pyricularia sp. CBS 133598]|nr:hypothetical protein PspLS_10620 [Pyricularia sp. CBS 133598]